MNTIIRQCMNGIAAVVLLAAVSLRLVPLFAYDRPRSIVGPLESLLSRQVESWQVRELEIADSAEMRNHVFRVLNFDDVIYRGYRHRDIDVQIYVAYWKPGSVPYGQAGVHTPDTCWVNGGWIQEQRAHAQILTLEKEKTKPAETGRYSMNGHQLNVVFWHLIGGQSHRYEQYGWRDGVVGVYERLPHIFQDIRRCGLNLAQEQIFVRVSSNVAINTLERDPAFARLLETLRPLGVFDGDEGQVRSLSTKHANPTK
jgi:hypothetical protein